jgi:hypothetical protein
MGPLLGLTSRMQRTTMNGTGHWDQPYNNNANYIPDHDDTSVRLPSTRLIV